MHNFFKHKAFLNSSHFFIEDILHNNNNASKSLYVHFQDILPYNNNAIQLHKSVAQEWTPLMTHNSTFFKQVNPPNPSGIVLNDLHP